MVNTTEIILYIYFLILVSLKKQEFIFAGSFLFKYFNIKLNKEEHSVIVA